MLRRDSIRITIIGFCLLLGMAGSVGIFFYNGMVDGLRDRGLANFDSYLQIGMNRIEDEIANIRTRTLFLARTPAMGNLVRAHYNGGVDPEDGSTEAELLAQLGTLFVRMAELNKHIYRIRLVGVERNGRELLEATRKGGMISLSPPSALNEIGESSFFREAIGLNPQEIYQSGFEVALAPENSLRGIRSFLRTATPLHNDTGEIFGILVIDVDTFSVMRQLRQSIPSEANIYLLNSRGELISRPPPWDMALEEQKGLSGLDPSLVSTVIEGESDSYSGVVTGKDEREIAIFARKFLLHHDSGEFVLAAMAIPMSVLRESADNIRAQISLIAILFSIFGALLLFAATNRHARPMEALTRAAHQILAGRPLSQINWPESADGPAGKLRDAFVEVITTILNREKQIDETVRRLETLTNGVADSIIMIDENGMVETVNQSTLKMFGYTEDEIIGKNVTMIMPESFRSRHDHYLRKYLETGRQDVFGKSRFLSGMKRDGTEFPIELTVSVSGEPGSARFIGIIRDISERDVVDRMKAEFVSTVSHELRTPLASMQGSLGLLEAGIAGELSPQAHELIETANGNCARLITLINDILDMEKIESGRMSFSFNHIDLARIVDTAVQECRGMGTEAGVTISTKYPDTPPIVLGDPDRLIQVVNNLLSNAIKFSPQGGVITVSIQQVGGAWRLSVADNGPGIPAEFRSQIFEKFTQADNSTRRRIGGSGLGLSICRSIVKAHMGRIDFRTSSSGTVFFVDLGISSETPQQVARTFETARGRVLLCVEDDTAEQLLSDLVESIGYEAFHCPTADTACKQLKSEWFDIVILDWEGSGTDAEKVVRFIHATPDLSDIPMIAISPAQTDSNELEYPGSASYIRQISKPLDENRLRNALEMASIRAGSGPLRVLHLEDEVDQQMVLRTLLTGIAEVDSVRTLREARARIAETSYDVVVLDQYVPDGSGLDLIETLKSQTNPPEMMVYSIDLPTADACRAISDSILKTDADNTELLQRIKLLLRTARSQRQS